MKIKLLFLVLFLLCIPLGAMQYRQYLRDRVPDSENIVHTHELGTIVKVLYGDNVVDLFYGNHGDMFITLDTNKHVMIMPSSKILVHKLKDGSKWVEILPFSDWYRIVE